MKIFFSSIILILFSINNLLSQNLKTKIQVNGIKSNHLSIKIPEGVYRVEIECGGKIPSNNTIKVESRRLIIHNLVLGANEYEKIQFMVDVRSPKINEKESIRIKERDQYQLNWDNFINFEFLGNSQINSIKIESADSTKTVFLAGDSTVADQDTEPWASWGQFFPSFFNKDLVIANYAESGSSLRDFKNSGRLKKILDRMKEGDYLFIEFGHNDQKQKGEGIGPWDSYSNYLKEYIQAARAKGGIPVLVSPTQRRHFNEEGKIIQTHGEYPAAMRKVSKDLEVPFIDLTRITTILYENWGMEESKNAFVHYKKGSFPGQEIDLEDNTHFNSFGANEIAKCIVQGIKDLNLDLKNYLKNDIGEYQPNQPSRFSEWTVPYSHRF